MSSNNSSIVPITVWGRRNSINVQKVLWAIAEIDLAHKQIDAGVPFPFNSTDPNFIAKNPNGKVPVIQDDNVGGFVLWESNAVTRYLLSKYQKPDQQLYPSDLVKRADADRWSDWTTTVVANPMGELWRGIVRTAPEKRNLEILRTSWKQSADNWRILNKHFQTTGNKYIIGDDFTFGDIINGGNVHRWFELLRNIDEVEKLGLYEPGSENSRENLLKEMGALSNYLDTLNQRPAFREHVSAFRT
eukprot:TRINITY_DN555_c1_g1_i1.p1 TRINITY_DN555_c1_g1~~TRINITY_DN555_c1_g1_i1.p1  ORF type:complete len:276 (+),score=84.27 TRINITY_DN555_c1_g1_i1:94-828(+)